MNHSPESKSKDAVRDAAAYLRSCGIHLPNFRVTAEKHPDKPYGGSFVDGFGGQLRVNLGRYADPTPFTCNWFAMHELGHVLWAVHRPLRWKQFRSMFGEPAPKDYDDLSGREVWKTAATWKLSWFSGPHRPKGEPSWYGARAGGEERFCELIGLMYAHGDFSKKPPEDLTDLWDCCWHHGLSRMT